MYLKKVEAHIFDIVPQPTKGYRYFRLILTGTDSSGSYWFGVSGLELYGWQVPNNKSKKK